MFCKLLALLRCVVKHEDGLYRRYIPTGNFPRGARTQPLGLPQREAAYAMEKSLNLGRESDAEKAKTRSDYAE